MGVIIPKHLPLWLARLLIGSGLYQLVMGKFMRLTRLTVRQALDQLSDNMDFKACMAYIFGDMGQWLIQSTFNIYFWVCDSVTSIL